MTDRLARRDRDLVVSGHVNVDRFLRVARFPGPDRTEPVAASRVELGGTATTIARVAATLGARVGLLSRIGDGFPERFVAELRRAGVDLTGLERVAGRPTPTCYIVEDRRGGQRTLIDQGPMGETDGPELPTAWIRRHAWVHVGTGPVELQLRIARLARDAGVRVAADPAQEIFYRWDAATFRRLLGDSELLFGNAAEIACAARLAGVADPAGLLARVPLVVRTEGPRGATAFSRAGREHVPAARAASVRTLVGAGDAFRGGFYAAFFAGQPLRSCLTAATRSARRWIEGLR